MHNSKILSPAKTLAATSTPAARLSVLNLDVMFKGEGGSMLPKCLNCGDSLSLSWLNSAFMSTKHRCIGCCQIHEFTWVRRLVSFVCSIVGIFFGFYLIKTNEPFWVSITIALVLFFLAAFLIPSQYRMLRKDEDSSNEQ